MKEIYQAVHLKQKIKEQTLRVYYLAKVWGLQQSLVAELEDITQPRVSNIVKVMEIGNTPLPTIKIDEYDLQLLHQIPRDILCDISLISFVQDVLKVDLWHPFYQWYGTPSQRMAGLSMLGIKTVRISEIFDKTSGTVSIGVKRNIARVRTFERPNRLNFLDKMQIKETPYETRQTKGVI